MKYLRVELDPAAQRRGRPRKGALRRTFLVVRLEQLDRTDVPAPFLEALLHRLRSGKRFPEFERAVGCHRRLHKQGRDNLIRALYYQFYELIGTARKGAVRHPILGDVPIPDCRMRSERAREMTRAQVHRLFGASPSVSTIRNLAMRRAGKTGAP